MSPPREDGDGAVMSTDYRFQINGDVLPLVFLTSHQFTLQPHH